MYETIEFIVQISFVFAIYVFSALNAISWLFFLSPHLPSTKDKLKVEMEPGEDKERVNRYQEKIMNESSRSQQYQGKDTKILEQCMKA